MICEVCGKEYNPPYRPGRKRKTCSDKCRGDRKKAYHREYDARPEQRARRAQYMREVYTKHRVIRKAVQALDERESNTVRE